METALTTTQETAPEPATYDAGVVARILGIAKPTVYEFARVEPDRFGVIRFGRAVRFRRFVIDRLARGGGDAQPDSRSAA